jgi:hypothetical protein
VQAPFPIPGTTANIEEVRDKARYNRGILREGPKNSIPLGSIAIHKNLTNQGL